MQACSLFDKFGIEEDREEEASFIAEKIAGIDIDTLYKCIKSYEERGIVNRAGRFAQIIPKPLAIRLAADWWRSTRSKRQEELIETEMPGQLERSFCDQVAKLDFLPQVKALIENLCGEQRPFGQAEVILSVRGSRLFRSLVEVNPKATSDALYKILSTFTHDGYLSIANDVRRNLVWALEKLCFHKEVFENSAKCLLWLASAENETWANNATGQFIQLFRTFLSGTEATPEERFELIDYAIEQDNNQIRELAIKALESIIDTHGGTRSVGAEYQGSGEPLVEWKPKIWREAFDYWITAIKKLTKLALENSEISQSAKNVIGKHIRGLIQTNRDVMLTLDSSIKKIVVAKGPLWHEAVDSIKTTISYDTDEMPDELRQKLDEWLDLLTPKRLEDRISLIVSIPSYEHKKSEDGHYIDIAAKNAEKFAQEFSNNISELLPYINQLLRGEQRQGYWFGRNIVIAAGQWEPLLSQAIKMLEKIESPNINFICGLLDGLYKINKREWDSYISKFKIVKILNKYYPEVVRTGKIEEEHLDTVIVLIQSGSITETRALAFAYGSVIDHLKPRIVNKFIKKLCSISHESAWVALDILAMYCHGDEQKWESCTDTFKYILINLRLDREKRSQQSDVYHWKAAAEKILKLYTAS